MTSFKKRLRVAGPVKREESEEASSSSSSHTILLTLENNKRYAHTASCSYQITMASLQPQDRRLPHCICESINEEKTTHQKDNKVIVIVEHDLKEFVLCVLEPDRRTSCKLDLLVSPGEQIAFRTIGKVPVQLAGVSSVPLSY